MSSALPREPLLQLPPAERLALIGALWDSLEPTAHPLSPAQTAELQRRLDRLDQDRADAVEWSVLKSDLLAGSR